MSYFGKIVKNTVIMFAVGILLAYAAPAIAGWVGIANPVHSILWNGAFFGGFGGIHAAVEPIINKLFSDTPRHTLEEKAVRTSPAVALTLPGMGGAALGDEAPSTRFQDQVGSNHSTDLSFQEKLAAAQAQPRQTAI